jgi:SAM-dependent methyltransferase
MVIEEDFATVALDPGFDLIVFSHALEHMRDPLAALMKARELLAPAGRIFVATPNASGALSRLTGHNWWQLDAPRHLVVLSKDGMRRVAARADLRLVDLHTHSIPMGPLVSRRLSRDDRFLIEQWSARDENVAMRIAVRCVSLGADLAGVGDNLHALLEKPQ